MGLAPAVQAPCAEHPAVLLCLQSLLSDKALRLILMLSLLQALLLALLFLLGLRSAPAIKKQQSEGVHVLSASGPVTQLGRKGIDLFRLG